MSARGGSRGPRTMRGSRGCEETRLCPRGKETDERLVGSYEIVTSGPRALALRSEPSCTRPYDLFAVSGAPLAPGQDRSRKR